MAKDKILAQQQKHKPSAVQRQQPAPEAEAGPLPAQQATEVMQAAEQHSGTPGRARMMRGMQ